MQQTDDFLLELCMQRFITREKKTRFNNEWLRKIFIILLYNHSTTNPGGVTYFPK